MNHLSIQVVSVALITAAALSMPPEVRARAEVCSGQNICWLGCPGNLTLFCEVHARCTPANPPYAVCEPGGCGGMDLVRCGGAV